MSGNVGNNDNKERSINIVANMLRNNNKSSDSNSLLSKRPQILEKLDNFFPVIQRANLMINNNNNNDIDVNDDDNGNESKRIKTIDNDLFNISSKIDEIDESESDESDESENENENKKIIEVDIAIVPSDNEVLNALNDNNNSSSIETSIAYEKYNCYMDYNATTPIDENVRKVMRNILKEGSSGIIPPPNQLWGNPSSIHQPYGLASNKALDKARKQVAELIGVNIENANDEIVFTSGGTESINLAIIGCILSKIKSDSINSDDKKINNKYHIVTSSLEHPAVVQSLTNLQTFHDVEITTIFPRSDNQYIVNPNDIIDAIRSDGSTILVSIMHVHNVSGVIQPISEIGTLIKEFRKRNGNSIYPLFHTDASQSVGKIDVDVNQLGIDMLSLAAHKFYGPKGVGALYINSHIRLHHISPIIYGGGQEKGLRSGTENLLLCIALGEACRVSKEKLKTKEEPDHLFYLLHKIFLQNLEIKLKEKGVNIHRFFPDNEKYLTPGVIFLGFSLDNGKNELIDGKSLLKPLSDVGIYVSAGSACLNLSSHDHKMNKDNKESSISIKNGIEFRGIRFSIGRYTKESILKQSLSRIVNVITESLKL